MFPVKIALKIILISIVILPACGQMSYEDKLKQLYKNTVPLITPAELQDFINNNKDFILLDTRSKEEYTVSHLKSAEFLSYEGFNIENVNHIAKDTPIILYCSVGYRSERIGEKLLNAGFTNVKNIYGGIFLWKNSGYPVYNQKNEETDSVHTYNKKWSKWLEQGIKIY